MDPAVLIQVWDEWAQFHVEAQGPETGCYLSWATEPAPSQPVSVGQISAGTVSQSLSLLELSEI